MIADIIKEVRRQLIPRERKAVTGLPFGTETYGVPPSTDFATLSRDGYEKNALIYACINELASSAAEAKLVVEKHKRQGWEPVPEHRLQKLMDNPNPLMSGYEFWFNTIIYLSLAGNCYWEEEPSKAGLIVGLWLMRPDLVSIKAIKTKVGERTREKIAAYEWVGATERITLPVDRVLHFKHPHPRDELYGFPPLAAAARQGDTDNYATDYVQSFFKNAAVPFGIFKVKGAYVDEAEANRVKKRLRAMYGSDRLRWHDPLILGEETDWVEMGTTFKDMDFPQLRMITETRICEVFQVPPILVGSYAGTIGTTYENYKEARRSFWLETLMPTYKKHADTLNLQLVPQFGKDIRVIWDFSAVRALQESKDAAWARATAAFQAAMITRNMAWKEIGEEPIPGGDVFLQPMMLLPVEAGEKLTTKRLPDVATKSAEIPEEAKERWAKAIDMVARSWEGVFEKAAKARLKEDKAALLKILRKEGKASTKAAPFETFMHAAMAYFIAGKEGWQTEFMPLMAGLMSAQADNILGAYGIAWDVTRPEVQEFLEAYSFEFAKGIVDVSEQGLRELVMQSQAEGWSVPTLRKAIEEDTKHYYDGVRAERIARTETIRSSNAGTQEAWREAGIEKKQWYTTFDGRQCGWCESMHEKVVSITSTFAEAGQLVVGDKTLDLIGPTQHPPLHPNCVVSGTKVIAPAIQAALRMFYRGEVIELVLANGTRLTVTPNHKILTPMGLIAASQLRLGNDVVYSPAFEGVVPGDPDNDRQPVIVEKIFDTLRESLGMSTIRVPVAPEYLHGDALFGEGHIDIIAPNGFLQGTIKPPPLKHLGRNSFDAGNANASPLSGQGSLAEALFTMGHAAHGGVGSGGKALALLAAGVGHSGIHRLAAIAGIDAILQESPAYDSPGDTQVLRQCLLRFASLVSTEKIINIKVYPFSGHVYDFQTFSTLYISNGVLSSNCRCTILAVFE